MSKGIWQFIIPPVIVVLLLLFFQKPLEEFFYQKPQPIPIATTEYKEKFCPDVLYNDPADFKISYQNVGNNAGTFTATVSVENATIRYKNSLEQFKEVASKSWYVGASQYTNYNFELNYTKVGQFQELPANVNVRVDLQCTYEISLPTQPLSCEGSVRCCKYAREGFNYKLISEQC